MSSIDPSTSPAHLSGGPSPRREGKFVRSPVATGSPPSPMTAAEIAGAGGSTEFIIATLGKLPMVAPVAEAEALATIVQSLTAQLAVANIRIQ